MCAIIANFMQFHIEDFTSIILSSTNCSLTWFWYSALQVTYFDIRFRKSSWTVPPDSNFLVRATVPLTHPTLRLPAVKSRWCVAMVWMQAGDGVFNKGRLYNTGVLQSIEHDTFNCFVFHDVDLLPEHDGNIYYCDQHVRHLSSAVDKMRYQ